MLELKRFNHNPILCPKEENTWESRAVMNPCVYFGNDRFHMLYRALSSEGMVLPNGKEYHYSAIGYANSHDGTIFERENEPLIKPEYDWEKLGCEDARFVSINDTYYIFYSAVSQAENGNLKVQIAGATTQDFHRVEKLGPIKIEGRSKAASFPEKVNGKYTFLYTQHADSPKSTILSAQVESVDQLFNPQEWQKTEKIPLLVPAKNAYRGPELGAPPIKTDKGWLLIYCPESFKREWFIGAALLDLNDPTRILAKTTKPLLQPEKKYELEGYVNNVTFPEGALILGNDLYVYYGGADQGCCLATCKIEELLSLLV